MEESSRCAGSADAEIIRRVQGGDSAAYAGLVERYERAVLATVLAVVHDAHLAQDVAQDAFVQCYLKLAGLRNGGRFGGWLLKIAHRQAVRAAARRKRDAKIALVGMEMIGGTEDRIFDDEKERLLDHVQKLPKHERLMVSLRYFGGWSVQEIAQMTNKPVGTVTKQLSRAVERLRVQFRRSDSHAR